MARSNFHQLWDAAKSFSITLGNPIYLECPHLNLKPLQREAHFSAPREECCPYHRVDDY